MTDLSDDKLKSLYEGVYRAGEAIGRFGGSNVIYLITPQYRRDHDTTYR